jgi:hypothetical protein
MLTYRKTESLRIVGYLDSNYAGGDRKSTSGYVFTLAGGAISWTSCKQTVTTSSTMYAEFVACYEATQIYDETRKSKSKRKVQGEIKGDTVSLISLDHRTLSGPMGLLTSAP